MSKNAKRRHPRFSVLRLNVEALITAFILAMAIRTFVVAPFKIPSQSMYPTLHGHPQHGDKIFVSRFDYFFKSPKRGDIVVFRTRGIEELDQRKDFIKRLVGLPGETLSIKRNHLYINGEKIESPEIFKEQEYVFHKGMNFGDPFHPTKIPPDHYFVMGDNTRNSKDSRYFGFVPKKNIHGRAFFIWWPKSRFGWLK